jgi:ADP-ribosylglycohydrolase
VSIHIEVVVSAIKFCVAEKARHKPEVVDDYCEDSPAAALCCVAHSASFEETVLRAANLGDDADTTAAIAGQLAGALYGVAGISAAWLTRLHTQRRARPPEERR